MTNVRDLASRYDEAASAYWRGHCAPLEELEAWLGRRWSPGQPLVDGPPAAVSPHAAGGRGLYWHQVGDAVLGVVPGRSGYYRVPTDARLPDAATDPRSTVDPRVDSEGEPEATMVPNPLRDLAATVLDQYGDVAHAAVREALTREGGERRGESADRTRGHAYDLWEISRQPLQPGCWVTVGEVTSQESVTLVEVNVATGRVRHVEASPA